MNFRDYVYIKLNQAKELVGASEYKIVVYEEREFLNVHPEEHEISVILKKMVSTLTFNTIQTPYQILIMSEQNANDVAFALMNKFAIDNNWSVIYEHDSKIKFQFSQPMVMNNFEIVGVGYRSVLFVSASTYEMEKAIDLTDLKIDGEVIIPISANLGYAASMDTVQLPSSEISESEKTTGAFALTIVVASKQSNLLTNVLNIVKGLESGNHEFLFSFILGNVEFTDIPLKLTQFTLNTVVNDIPSVSLSFVR